MVKKLIRYFLCGVYYAGARWLPASSFPFGKISTVVRYLICRPCFDRCGRNVNIEKGAFFHSGAKISIGDNSGIGINARLNGQVTIGNDVMMGRDVIIHSQNHRFDKTDVPMWRQGFSDVAPVVIEDDVWICDRVIILPGVRVGRGSVLGAGAVVSKNVPAWAVMGGNPAQLIRMRNA